MAILLILIALFGFVFAGFGLGSSDSNTGSSTMVDPAVKCSKRMGVKPSAEQRVRCGPPPANP
jgi:hypothetical protein